MTMELFCDSDIDNFSETSSDDQDDIYSIYGGDAQRILSSLEDSIGKIDDFLSFERGFIHGDIVCLGDPSQQMGKITNIETLVDLENVFGKVIKDVGVEKLLRVRSVLVGDYVILGPWLGRVEKVVDKVGILINDGTKVEILATKEANLLPISPNFLDDALYSFYPGQRVRLGQPNGSNPGGWLCGITRRNQSEGIVYCVDAGLVYVEWISSAIVGFNTTFRSPPRQQDPENLTLLSCFSHANWQLGDGCTLFGTCLTESGIEHRSVDFTSVFNEVYTIVKKKMKVDVMWQDGSSSLGLDSRCLYPVGVVNAHDFFPEQFVLEKGVSSDDVIDDVIDPATRRWGFVKCVDANEKTVKVKWSDLGGLNGGGMEEIVSAYELIEHPDYFFNIGDIVFKADMNSFIDYSNTATMEVIENGFLSCIGNVVGLKDGGIKVQWANGVVTEVAPCEVLHMENGSVTTSHVHDETIADVSEYEQSVHNKDISSDCQNNDKTSHLFSLSQAAFGFFTSFASNLFKHNGSTPIPQPLSFSHNMLESYDSFSEISMMSFNGLDSYENELDLKKESKESSDTVVVSSSSDTGGSKRFMRFDVVCDCLEHHFVDGVEKGGILPQMKRGLLKKVQQEWGILQKDLPETIYVRVYEDRMDLIRAAIVGASGTPYHDGLFFFDIFLPPDYPHVPPLVHYHSGGLRINPNLYECGKVCLSLLNTWTGTGSEVWNPEKSTILQILLSLQALVLNEKPYFNEAGYDDQIGKAEGEKNSVSYNENAYLGTCKSMLYVLRKPPKHFEKLVEEHFESRSLHILSACKAYMEGAPIGFPIGDEGKMGNSTGFKIMLAKLFPKLVEAFSNKGINCGLHNPPFV